MKIQTNKSLLKYNTFGIDVVSKYFIQITNIEELSEVIHDKALQAETKLVLGGGSNVLFTKDFNGLVLKNDFSGKEIVSEDQDTVLIKIGAGENWHSFVMDSVDKGYAGVENLSLIPGNVGASPMQNIGAYGVEVKDVVHEVEFIDLKTGEIEILKADACEFDYRSSIFKTKYSGQKFISHVTFKLRKNAVLNTSYGAIEMELERLNLEPTIKNVSQAVINIRRSKLPDPTQLGNAGSFFKNPLIDKIQSDELKEKYPDLPAYPGKNGQIKVAAGWLIEKAGWKGKTVGHCGVHKLQALVLVNYGGSLGSDILNLAENIQQSIIDTFGIVLEKEVNIL